MTTLDSYDIAVLLPCYNEGAAIAQVVLKGNVVRQMFSDIDADIYIMADGDGTYDSTVAPDLIEKLITDRLDMVVGTRRDVKKDAGRAGHAFGNRLFNIAYQSVFGRLNVIMAAVWKGLNPNCLASVTGSKS